MRHIMYEHVVNGKPHYELRLCENKQGKHLSASWAQTLMQKMGCTLLWEQGRGNDIVRMWRLHEHSKKLESSG